MRPIPGRSPKASLRGQMAGWVRNVRDGAVPSLPAHKWPWQWTYAIALEDRWKNIRELGGIYGDDEEDEPPREWWHDAKRVEAWVDKMKAKRK